MWKANPVSSIYICLGTPQATRARRTRFLSRPVLTQISGHLGMAVSLAFNLEFFQ